MWYFRILIFLFSFSAIGQNYYYSVNKAVEEYVPPSPTLLPDTYGAAAYPDSENLIPGGWITTYYAMETTITRHGSTALRHLKDDTPNVNDQERTVTFTPAGYASGKSYRLSGYSWHIDGTMNRVGLYDSGAGISRVTLSTSAGWQYFEVDFTAGSGLAFRIYMYGDGDYVLDDLELIELP